MDAENDKPRPSTSDAAEQLIQAVQRLSGTHKLDDVIDIVKRTARRMTLADGASFVLRDQDKCYYVDEDAIEPLWKGHRFPLEICISGWAMRNRQPALIPDVFADNRIPHEVYRRTFVKSLAMVPIRSLDPIGAIGIYWRDLYCPTPEAVRWLQSLADSAALAIEHVQTQEEVAEARYRAELLKSENKELRKEAHRMDGGDDVRMCFITKRLEWNGEWLSIESYLGKRFGLWVTHGLSPEAFTRLEANLDAR